MILKKYLYRKLHGSRSINEKSHACGVINISPNTSEIFH